MGERNLEGVRFFTPREEEESQDSAPAAPAPVAAPAKPLALELRMLLAHDSELYARYVSKG